MMTRTWLLAFVLGFILVIRMTSAASGGLPEQLEQCQADLAAAEDALAVALADLANCEASNPAFPGDGVTGSPLGFTNNGDGTVTDNSIGLTWVITNNTPGDAQNIGASTYAAAEARLDNYNGTCNGDAVNACTSNADCVGIGAEQCGYSGHTDWRLPHVKELMALFDYSASPVIKTSGVYVPPLAVSKGVWTSTPGRLADQRQVVDIFLGTVVTQFESQTSSGLIPVR